MATLTKKDRDSLTADYFAVPAKRALPLHDVTHVMLAWDMLDRTGGLTDDEKADARERIKSHAERLGLDTATWGPGGVEAAEEIGDHLSFYPLEAMALAVPETPDHPNKMPFSGVLLKLNQPSDAPPGGSGGKRVQISTAVATKALPSLLGMGVNITGNLAGHDPTKKVGIIDTADIVGDEIRVGGFIYASDFPTAAKMVKDDQSKLGMSFEAKPFTSKVVGNIREVTSLTFTGAAILKAKAAAYKSTSLAASEEDALDMTAEELAKMIAEANAPLLAKIEKLEASAAKVDAAEAEKLEANAKICASVEPHAAMLEKAADKMESDGVGIHPTRGHAVLARGLAKSMRASAVTGVFPTIHRDHDWPMYASDEEAAAAKVLADKAQADAIAAAAATATKDTAEKLAASEASVKELTEKLSTVETQLSDLKGKVRDTSAPVERRTLTAAESAKNTLSRYGVDSKMDDGQISDILTRAGVSEPHKRIAAKREIERAIAATA